MKALILTATAIIFAWGLKAQSPSPLSDDEIRQNHQQKISAAPGGNFYSRKFTPLPGDELRSYLNRNKDLKWSFCEALVNTVVRTLTKNLRRNCGKLQNQTIIWEVKRKAFILNYEAAIKNSVIIREECTLKFPGIKALTTLNGNMRQPPAISNHQLAEIIESLRQSAISPARVNIGVKQSADKRKAVNLLAYLGLAADATVYQLCTDSARNPQIKIILQ
ncbi:MAG: hypothetical protein PHV59_11580 [Victivallales bacterium]|nr:hypothetical protein [Victivallales bacterium]